MFRNMKYFLKIMLAYTFLLVIVLALTSCNKGTNEITSTTEAIEKSTATTKATTEVENSEVSTTTTLPSTTTTTAVTKSLTTTTTVKSTTTTTTYPNSMTASEAQALCNRLRAYGESKGLTWDTSLNENSSAVGYNTSMCSNTESISVEQAYERGCEYLDLKPISQGSERFNIVFWEVGYGYYAFRCYYF